MSRLSDPDDVRASLRKVAASPVIKNRKRKPLHPEEIARRLTEKAKAASESYPVEGWQWRYGWLLILWDYDGNKHIEHLKPEVSYADALEIGEEREASGDYEKAWLIRKTGERERK